jgi:prepilin-type N-terminal cleavage/methylation domain-containing protein
MKKSSNGFTIIELLVVISIIGILTTIGIVSFSSIQSGARNTQRSSR